MKRVIGTAGLAIVVGFLAQLSSPPSPSLAAGDMKGLSPIHVDSGEAFRESMAGIMAPGGPLPYHNGPTLICSDCHVMHASLQHNYAGGTGPEGNISSFPWSTTPAGYLLKFEDPLDLCLSCHDDVVNIPDVVGTDINALNERSAGFFDQPEVLSAHGHDLGRGLPPAGGFDLCMRCHFGGPGQDKVTCIDCHNPHGNGNPRNLQWASDPAGTPPIGLFTRAGASGMAKYERDNTRYGTDNTSMLREVTNICIDCHHVFSGGAYIDPDGDNIHERHPAYESERGSPNHIDQGAARGSTDPAHWEGGTGSGFDTTQRVPYMGDGALDFASADVVDASTNGAFCLSCHKAHGSANAFSMVWELAGAVERPGCDQCHAMKPLP